MKIIKIIIIKRVGMYKRIKNNLSLGKLKIVSRITCISPNTSEFEKQSEKEEITFNRKPRVLLKIVPISKCKQNWGKTVRAPSDSITSSLSP